MISKSTEEYLKVIYILKKESGDVRVTDIAKKMNCSKPSVTKQLNILKDNHLITYESYGSIEITKSGEELAKKVLADYDILHLFLKDIIGVSEENASSEAAKIKGVINEETLEKITAYVSNKLGLNKLGCNFNIRNEECRKCISNKLKGI